LAGSSRIETIQEPVASALASGWSAEESRGTWLVYDLGGGTFDASLLESQDGLLRVVGHDGDNFLGGRDFDLAVVDWLIVRLQRSGLSIERSNPAHASAVAKLKAAAEEVKIELSRAGKATLLVEDLEVGNESLDTFEETLTLPPDHLARSGRGARRRHGRRRKGPASPDRLRRHARRRGGRQCLARAERARARRPPGDRSLAGHARH